MGSPKAMSKLLGIGDGAWRTYEEGLGTPSWSTLQKLVDLGYSPTWLMTGEGEMKLSSAARPAADLSPGTSVALTREKERQLIHAISETIDGLIAPTGARVALSDAFTAAGKILDTVAGVMFRHPSAPADPDRYRDSELHARVFNAVKGLYKRERVAISDANLSARAALVYDRIVKAADDRYSRMALVDPEVEKLKQDIEHDRANPGSGKASA
ncbi:hypothetical protein [Aquabacter cavernae]|uniref:hypothetical protein n=1 Tax=Aquabacter cavernae TaxID=2496029 RepID=UPI000F8F45C8|nr:hypothetical protein [Aquabacter cavernae]